MTIKSAKLKTTEYMGYTSHIDKEIQERIDFHLKEALERLNKKKINQCIGCQDCDNEFNSACDIADHARIYQEFVEWEDVIKEFEAEEK